MALIMMWMVCDLIYFGRKKIHNAEGKNGTTIMQAHWVKADKEQARFISSFYVHGPFILISPVL